MTITERDILEIQAIIKPLLGKKAWGVFLGFGSFITLQFGSSVPLERMPKLPHGEWHLWITYCAWRLEEKDVFLAGCEDPRPELEQAVQHMEGLPLCSVLITAPAMETVLTFGDGVVLRLFPVHSIEAESWKLYTPDGKVLCIGPGAKWSYKSSSEPRDL